MLNREHGSRKHRQKHSLPEARASGGRYSHFLAIEIDQDGVFFKYKADVWHGADWTPLGEFVKRKFGALGFAWIGDEPGMDLFNILHP